MLSSSRQSIKKSKSKWRLSQTMTATLMCALVLQTTALASASRTKKICSSLISRPRASRAKNLTCKATDWACTFAKRLPMRWTASWVCSQSRTKGPNFYSISLASTMLSSKLMWRLCVLTCTKNKNTTHVSTNTRCWNSAILLLRRPRRKAPNPITAMLG